MTQLEHARLGHVTPEMRRVAQREAHLTPEQVRDEVAAGRMVIPANRRHLDLQLDPMCIGRASLTKINANLGASPVSSGTHEEIEKLQFAERWGADTVMDLSTGGDLDATRESIVGASAVPIGTVPIYSMIIGRTTSRQLDEAAVLQALEHQAQQGVDYFTIHAGVLRKTTFRWCGIGRSASSAGGARCLRSGCFTTRPREPDVRRCGTISAQVVRRYDVTFSIGDGSAGPAASRTPPMRHSSRNCVSLGTN